MSENQGQQGGYGYEEGGQQAALSFGLNQNVYLDKFEWTANGGKDGAEMEAVNINFKIGDSDKGYKQFPVTRAFGENNEEITDPTHPAFIQAQKDLSAKLVHIVGVFVPKEDIQTALRQPIKSFKEYIKVLSSLLPKNYNTIPLDIFLGYQWQITGENKKTFLEIPKKMTSGRWLNLSVPAVGGVWQEERKDPATVGDSDTALRYVDAEGNVHPFFRNGWYIKSNYATQQNEDAGSNSGSGAAMNNSGAAKKGW